MNPKNTGFPHNIFLYQHSGSSRHKTENITAFSSQVAEHDEFLVIFCHHRGVNRLKSRKTSQAKTDAREGERTMQGNHKN